MKTQRKVVVGAIAALFVLGSWWFAASGLSPSAINQRFAQAVLNGDPVEAEWALERNANPNAVIAIDPETKAPAICLACGSGNEELLRTLLKHGANPNLTYPDGWTTLLLAIGNENVTMVRLLLESGADPNQGAKRDSQYHTPLSEAKRTKRENLISVLKQAGAKE